VAREETATTERPSQPELVRPRVQPELQTQPLVKIAKTVTRPKSSRAETPPRLATSADDLVLQAQQAWLAGQLAGAIGKAEAAIKAGPKPAQLMQAYELIATCSCALHKRDGALDAASHLSNARRDMVKAACQKNGVPFE